MNRRLLIVGSVAYDSVETPSGSVDNALGGSGLFGSAAASLLSPVDVVAVVGNDFELDALDFLKAREVDLSGLEIADGKTFRWAGVYETDVNIRHTRLTELNVFADFSPEIPASYSGDQVVFLGNIAPELQGRVLDQLNDPEWVALDTMDFWINGSRDALLDVMKRVHMIIINDSEARLLTGIPDLIKAAHAVLEMGPKAVVIKKGEHGVLLCTEDGFAALPALPLDTVVDPTGAGDVFAGGMLGWLTATGDYSSENLRRALAYGTVTASLVVEAFSLDALRDVSADDLKARYRRLQNIAMIPDVEGA